MKIEMGESLFYSWLRHVKDCQIVQTNWKPSPQWVVLHIEELEKLWTNAALEFEEKFGYKVFKKTSSLSQFLRQAECDVLGSSIQEDATLYYAVDVAFHEGGLSYGSREETVVKIITKCIRTALCLYGYLDAKSAEIVFAAPKITPSVLHDVTPCIQHINKFFAEQGFQFKMRLICNEEFNTLVLNPILIASEGVADTAELFLRAYQLVSMFSESEKKLPQKVKQKTVSIKEVPSLDSYNELKIGKLAQTVLRSILEDGNITSEELQWMQSAQYSKQMFDLQYPLLVAEKDSFDPVRYYVKPLSIRGERYYICSQWFETSANNDRPYLLRWIEQHT